MLVLLPPILTVRAPREDPGVKCAHDSNMEEVYETSKEEKVTRVAAIGSMKGSFINTLPKAKIHKQPTTHFHSFLCFENSFFPE